MIFNDIPQQAYAWKLKEIERSRQSLRDETFVGANGERRWKSNPTSVIPMDVFRDAYVTPPASQQAERDACVEREIGAYRERMKNYVPSAEEQFEMRAAFGPGRTVVNIITGQEFRT